MGVDASGSNGIFVTNSQALSVTGVEVGIFRVQSDGTASTQTDNSLSDLVTQTNGGDIVLQVLSGDLTVTDGPDADGIGIYADGKGNILLQSQAGAVIISENVQGNTGNVSILSSTGITQSADIITGGGTVDVETSTGSINMGDGVKTRTADAHIRYKANQNIQVGD